ncbi:MAG: MoaD/ThiS family protein [Euryarchaeota archaeon]|nr:MoaD/ThiS family protein [Euryarchaeota archaeon]MDE1836042.1 MoaD/ThiS family protein [Euryarchaeota archaeon]MDE1881226.1 MoaD/ThiS family protein [Euryarchaeota archaeon]MDE2044020.1 MoaD/ThiS family protein [Thermoplasmata archaeon]
MRVLLFAGAREAAGGEGELRLRLSREGATTLEDLLQELVRLHPPLARVLPHARIAVNGAYVPRRSARFVLQDADEVALLPPYSGG